MLITAKPTSYKISVRHHTNVKKTAITYTTVKNIRFYRKFVMLKSAGDESRRGVAFHVKGRGLFCLGSQAVRRPRHIMAPKENPSK